jgi:hypothetical protein
MDWVAATYPKCAGATISAHDIARSFFPRFKVATGRHHLKLGTLLRAFQPERREYRFTDGTGRRRTGTEYLVPRRRRA